MLTPELAHLLFQYNEWADQRILNACSGLTNEQFTQDLGSSFPSIRDTLAHICGAAWLWKERLSGRAAAGLPPANLFPDLAAVRVKLEEMDRYYLNYVAGLAPADLARTIQYKSLAGQEFSTPIWQALHQLSNHGTYHRGQVVTMLRQLGAKGVSTDLIGFYREQAAAAKA